MKIPHLLTQKRKNPIQNLTKNILGKNISGKIISDKDKLPVGTINILLYIDADLSKEALASALVSCTEAKVAAMQELLIASRYSCGIATEQEQMVLLLYQTQNQRPTLLTLESTVSWVNLLGVLSSLLSKKH